MKQIFSALILSLTFGVSAWADSSAMHGGMNHEGMNHANLPQAGMSQDAKASTFSQGMARKVDKSQGKLTLRHGPLENLDMPAMTMIFRVTDPAWLDQVKPGDNLRFRAEMMNGHLTVTHLEIVH